ncbi:DUF2892 domain-containing protein [bacterium]|nr:DUF2892 domain-containing protein [bacterium]
MKCNVGNADRMFRIIGGMVIIALGLIFQSWWGVIGLLPILTGTLRWCPLYLPFKISTDKTNQA